MTPERIAELRYWLQRGPRPPLDMEATIAEALDEIERLQARKAAPTREAVHAAVLGSIVATEPGLTGRRLSILGANDVADSLAAAGLLAELEREPHTYWWVRIGSAWQPGFWTGNQWFVWGGGKRDRDAAFDEIGPRIEGPPQTGKD